MYTSSLLSLFSLSFCKPQNHPLASVQEDLIESLFPLFRLQVGSSRFFGRLDEACLLQIRKPERLQEEEETACECSLRQKAHRDSEICHLYKAPSSSLCVRKQESTHQFETRTSNHRRPGIESDSPARPVRVTCQADERMQSTIAAWLRSVRVEGLTLRFGRGEIPDQEAAVYRACERL